MIENNQQWNQYSITPMEAIPKICVVIRKRPLTKKEMNKNDVDIIEIRDNNTVIARETKTKVDLTKYIEEHVFAFDQAFDENTTNEQLYMSAVRPLVDAVFQKAKTTCFAYGQTGSGKTYTMMGSHGVAPGLYVMAAQDIFNLLQLPQYGHLVPVISFYEIYCGKLHDLLNERQVLHAREDAKQNVNIVGLSEKKIYSVDNVLQVIEYGTQFRITGQTGANLDSSRSHAILQIALKEGNKQYGKMSFIDLAGSERGADVTDSNKQTRFDGAEINKSLLALKECIRALDQDKKHTPFRGSKLTQVLKDSFVGNCKTVMIGNISPTLSNCEHSLNTIRYADRVKELKRGPGSSDFNNGALSQFDRLARELMLPRQEKNTTKTKVKEEQNDSYSPGQNQGLYTNFNQQNNSNLFNNNNNNNNHINNNNYHGSHQPQNMEKKFSLPNNFGASNSNTNKIKGNQGLIQQGNQNNNQTDSLYQNITEYQHQNNPAPNFKPRTAVPQVNKQNIQVPQGQNGNQQKKAPIPYQQQQGQQQNQKSNQIHQNQNSNLDYFNQNMRDYQFNNSLIQQDDCDMQNEEMWNIPQKTAPVNNQQLENLSIKHEQLISQILQEEEEIISSHRQHIDDMVELIKQEMMILHDVDKPGSNVDDYVENLDALLLHKLEIISILRQRLLGFKEHLKEEEQLSKKFYEQRNEALDVFDLNSQNININELGTSDDMQLLEELPNQNLQRFAVLN